MATKYPHVKFLKIQATNCVTNFRDQDVPSIFIYKDGEMFKKFLPAPFYFGGSQMNWKKVEWIFNSLGVIKTDLVEDPFEEKDSFKMKKKTKINRDDESDSDDGKESRWKI